MEEKDLNVLDILHKISICKSLNTHQLESLAEQAELR
jgi:hypothetical protein